MAGASLLEREQKERDQRTARVREAAYEEVQQAKDEYAGYDIARAMESVRTSSAMPAPQQPVNQTAAPEAPMRSKELFSDYVYKNGELLRKSPDSDMMIPVFETVRNIVEEQYFDIPDYTPMEMNAPEAEAVAYEEEEDDALPTRRTLETIRHSGEPEDERQTSVFAGLSTRTKIVLAAIAATIVLLLAVICINTAILKSIDSGVALREGTIAGLSETLTGIESEIADITSPEYVENWAAEHGMTPPES